MMSDFRCHGSSSASLSLLPANHSSTQKDGVRLCIKISTLAPPLGPLFSALPYCFWIRHSTDLGSLAWEMGWGFLARRMLVDGAVVALAVCFLGALGSLHLMARLYSSHGLNAAALSQVRDLFGGGNRYSRHKNTLVKEFYE